MVILQHTAVSSTPVLYHIPVSTFAAITRGNSPLVHGCRVHLTDDTTTFFCKVPGQHTFILQSPEYYTGRIAALLYPLTEELEEIRTKGWSIIPYMSGKLTPEEDTLFIQQLLIIAIMRLMGFTESVKSCLSDFFHTGCYLLMSEGMASSQNMFILTGTIYEHGFFIEQELFFP